MNRVTWSGIGFAITLLMVTLIRPVQGQDRPPAYPPHVAPKEVTAPGEEGSRNIHVVSHVPLGGFLHVADIAVEQEMSRPYVYVAKRFIPTGVDIISIKDPARARVIWEWRIENADLHRGAGSLNPMYLKSHGRYYLTNAFQFVQGGPDLDLGAIVWDVTGLPDTSKVKEIARIRETEFPGGFHESFSYKHSNGQALLVSTTNGPFADVWDIDQVAAAGKGDPQTGMVARIPIPSSTVDMGAIQMAGYHDFYIGYEPVSKQDRFYGGGKGGYYVYDITNLKEPKLLTSITGAAGVNWGHTFTPDPTGRYAVTEIEYQYAPLRIFDLKPGLDGQVKTISRPVGAWTADWRDLSHNHLVRWPYVFVAAYEDGLQIFNMMDPTNPYTVGYYRTYGGPHESRDIGNVNNGGWGVDIRNADGLILLADMTTGFWAFKMDGFDGWNGHQWGMPNVSSAQDWDNGPDGAPQPGRVS